MNRRDRIILHHTLSPVVLGQLRSAWSNADWLMRTHGKGLNKKEKEYLKIQLDQLQVITSRIDRIYHRTKY